MNKDEIRQVIKRAGLFQYQVADEIGINEITFIRWLRKPLESDRERVILQAIKTLSSKKGA
jgi:hypothetical protein